MVGITSFRQLETWQEAHKLVLMVYRVTADFPPDERFGLVSQMRRAAASVPANIAEGFKRRGVQDKIRFYNVAEGSLEELKYFILLSHDLGYIAIAQTTDQATAQTTDQATDQATDQTTAHVPGQITAQDLTLQSETVGRLLNGLINSTERRK